MALRLLPAVPAVLLLSFACARAEQGLPDTADDSDGGEASTEEGSSDSFDVSDGGGGDGEPSRHLDGWPHQTFAVSQTGRACEGQTWKKGFYHEVYGCLIDSGGRVYGAGTCVARRLHLSQDCGYCLGHLVHCGSVHCAVECCKGRCPTSLVCRGCNNASLCHQEFQACAGVLPPIEQAVQAWEAAAEERAARWYNPMDVELSVGLVPMRYYQQADVNSDGIVSHKEFWWFVGYVFNMPSSSRRSMFAILDVDLDGLLAYSEFSNGFYVDASDALQLGWTAAGTDWGPTWEPFDHFG